MVGSTAATWHMLVADDYHLEAGGKEFNFALIAFFVVCSIVGVPLSWNKTGGETVTWVGFELLHRTRQLGISQRRADWFRRWTTEVASSSSVHMASFEEGLGRVMYVAGALENERPFLRSSLQVYVSSPARLGQGGAAICFLLPQTPGSADLRMQALRLFVEDVSRSTRAQSGRPSQFRPHRNRRMVSSCRSVGTGQCQVVKVVLARDHER